MYISAYISCATFAWSSKLTVDIDSMGPGLQLLGGHFSNFLLGKVSLEFKLHGMSIFHDIQMATYLGTWWCYSHMVGYAGSPTYTAYVDMTLTQSEVKVTGLLNFRQLAKPSMLAAMTAAPMRGFLVEFPSRKAIKRVQTSSSINIWWNSNGHISVVRYTTVTWLSMQVVLHVLCTLTWPWPDSRSRSRSRSIWTSDNCP